MQDLETTRKYSSGMCTARSPTMYATEVTRCQHLGGPQVNKFEQVSSHGNQIPLVVMGLGQWGATVHGWGIMSNSHVESPCEQTDMTENITFP